MKKMFFNLIVLLSFILVFVNCNNKEESIQSSSSEVLKFEDFEKMGILHNQFLTNLKENFQISENIVGREEGIEYVNQFNQAFADEINLSISEKGLLKKYLEENKRFVDTSSFYQEVFVRSNNLRNDGESSQGLLLDNLEESYEKDLIDVFEYENLKLIGLKTKENYDGIMSDNELKSLLIDIKEAWISKNYEDNSEYGRTLAFVLTISLSSLEWWEENPDAPFFDLRSTTALPALVGADIAGAIVGGVSGGIGSYIITGSVNWGSVGWGAASGAICGSTGVVGKLGGWITSLF